MRVGTWTPTLATALILAAATACEPAGQEGTLEQSALDTVAILSEFDSLRTAFEEDFAAGDVEAMAATYAEDAIYSEPGRPAVRGRDSIRALMARTHPEGASIEIEPMDVIVLGNDWVFEFGTGTVTVTPEGADRPVEIAATYSALFRRTAEGWVIHREALSSNAPPPAGGQ